MSTVSDSKHKCNVNLPFPPRHRIPRRRWPSLFIFVSLILPFVYGERARAGFQTIIDSPPAEFERNGAIGSNTQVNLYPGGVLPVGYHIGPAQYPADNIEINLLGGTIGDERYGYRRWDTSSRGVRTTNVTINLVEGNVWGSIHATAGALLTVSGASVSGALTVDDGSLAIVTGGRIEQGLHVNDGSMVRMSGGTVGSDDPTSWHYVDVFGGSAFLMSGGKINGDLGVGDGYASITGGSVAESLSISSTGQLELAGGAVGPIRVSNGGSATLIGGEFRLNGVSLGGLFPYTQSVDFSRDSVLTGVLSDGTPIIVSGIGYGYGRDDFADNRINIRSVPVPPNEPAVYDTLTDPVPVGLRAGQALTLRSGAVGPANFAALPGSTVSIVGGEMGNGFEAAGASVTLSAGSIGMSPIIYQGTTLQVLGGQIGSNFEVTSGSRLEVRGGTIGPSFYAHPNSEVIYSGGEFNGDFSAEWGSSFVIVGGEFRINGAPIAAPATTGALRQVDVPEYGVLSGTASDGTPFIFGGPNQRFAPGTLTLQVTELPANSLSPIRVPGDPAPRGLRSGQTLLLGDGGELGDYFTAGWDSIVRMTGGRIGDDFQTVGSLVNVTGGEIGSLNALFGSVVNLDGGTVLNLVSAQRGAIVNISAGEIAGAVVMYDGGRVNVTGGTLGGYVVFFEGALNVSGGFVRNEVRIERNSSLTLAGGELHGPVTATRGSQLNIHGGRLGDGLVVAEGAQATLRGTDIRIDGQPVGGDFPSTAVDLPPGAVLSGVFADGTPFAFTSSDGDLFSPGTLQVVSSSYHVFPPIKTTPRPGVRPGEKVTLKAGEQVSASATAGWGSELTIDGGEVGDNFEAVGGRVILREGSIGEDMDVFFGAEFNVHGGTVGYGLQAHRGSVVNISGGIVRDISARSGSTVNITGGTFGRYDDDVYAGAMIFLEAGSELHVTGADFRLNGGPVEGLEAGNSISLEWEDYDFYGLLLSARLLDGSSFSVLIEDISWSISDDWQFEGSRSITLTAVPANAIVPEPSSFAIAMAATLMVCILKCNRTRRGTVS